MTLARFVPSSWWRNPMVVPTAAFVACILACAAAGIWGYRITDGCIAQAEARRVDDAAVGAFDRLTVGVREAESGVRGYLICRDAADLESYRDGVAEAGAALRAVAVCERWAPAETRALEADVAAKLDALALAVDLASRGRHGDAMSLALDDRGRELTRAIHKRADRLVYVVVANGGVRVRALESSARQAMIVIPAVGLVAPFGAACTLVVWRREAKARAVAEAHAAVARAEWARNNRLLNSMSHDLRRPLQSITQQIDLAKGLARMRPDDTAALIVPLDESLLAMASLKDMLDGFLETARAGREVPEIATFPVGTVVVDVAQIVAPAARAKGIVLKTACRPGVVLRSDRSMIKRILMNLADNAVKYTDAGSVTIAVEERAASVDFVVSDTGRGMGDTLLIRIGRDFEQGHNLERDPRKGFGLGLSTSRRLADQLGATITVKSAPGSGTTFRLAVPPAPPPVPPPG